MYRYLILSLCFTAFAGTGDPATHLEPTLQQVVDNGKKVNLDLRNNHPFDLDRARRGLGIEAIRGRPKDIPGVEIGTGFEGVGQVLGIEAVKKRERIVIRFIDDDACELRGSGLIVASGKRVATEGV